MNKELLLKVADAIEQNPTHYDQSCWRADTNFAQIELPDVPYFADPKDCGTYMCVAGWVVALTPPEERLATHSFTSAAGAALNMHDKDRRRLFNSRFRPNDGTTVPQVLRSFANGVPLEEISTLSDDEET